MGCDGGFVTRFIIAVVCGAIGVGLHHFMADGGTLGMYFAKMVLWTGGAIAASFKFPGE